MSVARRLEEVLFGFAYGPWLWMGWVGITAVVHTAVFFATTPSIFEIAAVYITLGIAILWLLAGASAGWLPNRI